MDKVLFQYPEAIVSGSWLESRLDEPGLRIFDCTTYLAYEEHTGKPYRVVSGREDYDAGHIPGSGFLDLQRDFSVGNSPYAFTLPSPAYVAAAFARHGIGDDTSVVLYSRKSMQWATRFWWMLRWLEFDHAAILDGGYDKWANEGRPVSTEPRRYPAGRLSFKPRDGLFVKKDEVIAAIDDPNTCIINALSSDLHAGTNPRYGRPGRIPRSKNVPASQMVSQQTMQIIQPERVDQAFSAVGAEKAGRVVAYCGGGIAATMDAFLLHQLGYTDIAVYDNSMSEWAKDSKLPIETD